MAPRLLFPSERHAQMEQLHVITDVHHAKGFEKLVEIDHAVLVEIDARSQIGDLLLVELRAVVFAEKLAYFSELFQRNHT